MEVCRTSRLGIQPLLLLVALPFADLIPRHAVEEAVLVADAEEPSGEPPLDRATNRCSAAPAIGIAATLVIRRVMNALEQRALGHCQSLASCHRGGQTESEYEQKTQQSPVRGVSKVWHVSQW
jgi:hypothetical protein